MSPVDVNLIRPRYHSKDVGVPPAVAASHVKLMVTPTLIVDPEGQPVYVGSWGGSEKWHVMIHQGVGFLLCCNRCRNKGQASIKSDSDGQQKFVWANWFGYSRLSNLVPKQGL
jgi:hypothetical protein